MIVSKDSFKRAVFDAGIGKKELSVFQTLIVDESHYVKNAASQVTQAVQQAAAAIDHVLLLTGTPVLNAPGELYAQLELVQPKSKVPKWTESSDFGGLEKKALAKWAGTSEDDLRKSKTGFYTFQSWDDAKSRNLRDYLRERGARRSRSDYAASGGSLYRGKNLPSDMRKVRSYNVMKLPPEVMTELEASGTRMQEREARAKIATRTSATSKSGWPESRSGRTKPSRSSRRSSRARCGSSLRRSTRRS